MIALFDLDSLLYHSVYRIVSIQEMKELLSVNIDTLPYSQRKELAFNYIVEIAIDRMGNKLLKVLDAIENTGHKLNGHELYITNCSKSIRKNLDPEYKAKRKRNKWVSAIRKYLIENDNVIYDDEYEADDLIADRAKEMNEANEQFIVVSIDKDLKQIPGWHFDYYVKKWIDKEGVEQKQMKGLFFTSPFDSWQMLGIQVLMGDAGDGIRGIPGIGKVKAERLLYGCKTREQIQNKVVRAYIYHSHLFEDSDWRMELFKNYRLIYLGKS